LRQLDEGLVGPERVAQFFGQDPITTFSRFEAFLGKEILLHGADEFLKFRAAWMEPYDDFSYEPVRIIDVGANRVVVTFTNAASRMAATPGSKWTTAWSTRSRGD